MNAVFHRVWDLPVLLRLAVLAGIVGWMVYKRWWNFNAFCLLFVALLFLFGNSIYVFTHETLRPFLGRALSGTGRGVEGMRRFPFASRIGLVAAGILVCIRFGLGIGYAFLLGAIATGILWGQDLEDLVNSISGGANRGETLRMAAILFGVSALGEMLERVGALAAWERWFARRTPDGRLRAWSLRLVEGLLPHSDGAAYGAGEPPEDEPERRRARRRLEHPAGYILPFSPVFLVAVTLAGVPLPMGFLLFLPLAVVAAAGALRFGFRDASAPPAASMAGARLTEEQLWITLVPWAGVPFGSWGILAAVAAGIAALAWTQRFPLREVLRHLWRNCHADLAVLVMGTQAFAYTVVHCGALRDAAPLVPQAPLVFLAAAFALPFIVSLAGGWPMAGIAMAFPFLFPVPASLAAHGWVFLVAAYGGGVLGAAVLRAALPTNALVAAASVLPGLLLLGRSGPPTAG